MVTAAAAEKRFYLPDVAFFLAALFVSVDILRKGIFPW